MEKDKIRRKIKLNWSTNGTLVGAKDLRQDKKTGFLSLGHLWIKINFTIFASNSTIFFSQSFTFFVNRTKFKTNKNGEWVFVSVFERVAVKGKMGHGM